MSDKFVMSARQAAELDYALERNGWTPADVKRLSEGNVLTKVKKFLGLNSPQEAGGTRLPVNYDFSLPEMIAAGRYDWANSDITAKRFPTAETGTKEIVVEVAHFGCNMSSEDVVKELAKRGLRPANLAELLAYGAAYPEEQRKYPIVALGSVARVFGWRGVPYLFEVGSERRLSLDWWGGGWGGRYRFLTVRNSAL
jgi:hypothetical protein